MAKFRAKMTSMQSYQLYQMDYWLIGIIKVPVNILYQMVIKLQDYGLLSNEKWIFRKHTFYGDCFDFWHYWIQYNYKVHGFPDDIYQITGMKSGIVI